MSSCTVAAMNTWLPMFMPIERSRAFFSLQEYIFRVSAKTAVLCSSSQNDRFRDNRCQ